MTSERDDAWAPVRGGPRPAAAQPPGVAAPTPAPEGAAAEQPAPAPGVPRHGASSPAPQTPAAGTAQGTYPPSGAALEPGSTPGGLGYLPAAGYPHTAPARGGTPPPLGPPSQHTGQTGPTEPEARPRAARRRSGVPAGVVVLLVLVGLLVGAIAGLLGARWVLPTSQGATPTGLPTADPRPVDPVGDTWISDIAAATLPSTVYIEVRVGTEGVTGSGFVVREDGYIVTNDHVIASAKSGGGDVTVLFPDGSKEDAEIVGSTADYDLAVLRIDRTDLVPLVLGDSDTIAVGDPVIAVGAPLGLTGSVTAGIVSAVDRPVTVRSPGASGDDPSTYINAIQTDASINRGNSGGPLIDAAGQVVGVNTAVARDASSGGGGNEPGFAIPSNQVRHTVEQLIETGRATYPVIGVLLDVEHDGEGVRVRSDTEAGPPVVPGSPADQAGIEPGDVIVAVDGRPVSQPTELIVRVRSHLPGETIVLTVRSGSGDREVEVVLGEQVSE